ncbi:MAG TPA: metalloregulator ArsR/SmtB family transcription factor [Rhizobium sp.]
MPAGGDFDQFVSQLVEEARYADAVRDEASPALREHDKPNMKGKMLQPNYPKDAKIMEFSRFLKLLSHPTRLQILNILSEKEETIGELAQHLQTPLYNLAPHLALLRRHKAVETRKVYRVVYYRCTSPAVQKMLATLHAVLNDP